MNGPEHYRMAEALLDSCRVPGADDIDDLGRTVPCYPSVEDDSAGGTENACLNALLAAQIHATLALTAANANTQHLEATPPLAERPSAWDRGQNGAGLTWADVTL